MPTQSFIDDDGFLNAAWQLNNEIPPKRIFPYLVQKRRQPHKTFDVSLTGKSDSYKGIEPDAFLKNLVAGGFPKEATVRMKERGKSGAIGNGWLIRNLRLSEELKDFFKKGSDANESLESIEELFRKDLRAATEASPEALRKIKESYPRIPEKVLVETSVFRRNPAVVIEVLQRAGGVCEMCGNTAPFNRRSDGAPYLEVHHKVTLASGGEDSTENAVALCPNCHRREHFG